MITYIDPETKLLYEVIKTITDEYMLDIDELYKYLNMGRNTYEMLS